MMYINFRETSSRQYCCSYRNSTEKHCSMVYPESTVIEMTSYTQSGFFTEFYAKAYSISKLPIEKQLRKFKANELRS